MFHKLPHKRLNKLDDLIYLIGGNPPDFNGSEIQKMQLGRIEGQLRSFDLKRKKQTKN